MSTDTPVGVGEPTADGKQECDACGKVTWMVTHSCSRVPRTDAAKERYARSLGHASWGEMLKFVGLEPLLPQPVHPRKQDRWTRETQVPGWAVAVDAAGCIVMHTPAGAATVTNVQSLIEDLQSAVSVRDSIERGTW